MPAPARGALVKRFGELLTEHKDDLATLVSLEVGKITSEARGEVQEMIDICDFAVGLSRQLYGRTMPSERPGHRLMETWHPLGVVGVISAFNFPAAVWSWNTAVALVCGDPVVWKPSELTPLTSLACHGPAGPGDRRARRPARRSRRCCSAAPRSARRSSTTPASRCSAPPARPGWAARSGRGWPTGSAARCSSSGGNNAAVVSASADLDLTMRGIVFSAAGTAGQRCTTMRRVIAHRGVVDELTDRLAVGVRAAADRQPDGRRHPRRAADPPRGVRRRCRPRSPGPASEGGKVVDRRRSGARGRGARTPTTSQPAIVRMRRRRRPSCAQETFAPLLYVLPYDDFDEAIALNNAVPQGLSSSVFTSDQAEAERFLSADGSDCGIVNVNIGTSGAEIGGAFGGEKETGGGRESGSDAWRAYMRRATNTVNFSGELPLAQGVDFTV